MANTLKEQRIIDSNKRSLIKYVFLSDGTAVANSTLADASTLQFALNTSGYIMTSNTDPKTNYRTTIKRIFGNAKVNSYISLQWAGSANDSIVTISNGMFDYDFQSIEHICHRHVCVIISYLKGPKNIHKMAVKWLFSVYSGAVFSCEVDVLYLSKANKP